MRNKVLIASILLTSLSCGRKGVPADTVDGMVRLLGEAKRYASLAETAVNHLRPLTGDDPEAARLLESLSLAREDLREAVPAVERLLNRMRRESFDVAVIDGKEIRLEEGGGLLGFETIRLDGVWMVGIEGEIVRLDGTALEGKPVKVRRVSPVPHAEAAAAGIALALAVRGIADEVKRYRDWRRNSPST